MSVIAPGGTIGILGGGQLGRMTAMAAARLGYRTHIYAPEADSPAAEVATAFTCAAFADRASLDRFAVAVDVVTLEFENVPTATLEHLAARVPVRPGAAALAVCQDRIAEKTFVAGAGVPVAPFRRVTDGASLTSALVEIGLPAVLKTARLGYDGKGQAMLVAGQDAGAAFASLRTGHAILEGFVDYRLELSVITARGIDGAVATYVPVENRHRHHVLTETIVPAPVSAAVAAEATRIAELLAASLEFVGLLAVEMFLTADDRVLVNELAPRPHNSGHWTIDACAVSQFELLVRAVCGLPLGDTTRVADARMANLLGDDVEAWPALLAEPGARLHLYGKREARPGRKMGHVTRLVAG